MLYAEVIDMKHICTLLLSLLLLSGAVAGASSWEDVPYMAFYEPNGYSLINVGPGCAMQTEAHRYLFLKAVPEATREQIIRKTEAALNAFEALGAADRALTVHVVKGHYAPRVDGDTLYIGTASYDDAAYVTGVAKLVFGNHVNYGLLYGVSCEVAAQLGEAVEAPLPLTDALAALHGDARALLDLNYACFIEPYADEAAQAIVKAVARAFAASLTDAEKAALLNNYSDAAFYARLNDFLTANGQPAHQSEAVWGVAFHGGGDGSVRLRWDTASARYVLDDDFEDFERTILATYGEEQNPLNEDYAALRRSILAFEDTLTQTKALVAPYLPKEPITIWFENKNVNYQQSYNRLLCVAFYDPAGNALHVGSVGSLGHEYVHAITAHTDATLTMEECLAYYIGSILTADNFALMAEAVESNDHPDFLRLKERVSTREGHPIDCRNPDDYLAILEASLYESLIAPGFYDPWEILSERAFTTAATGIDTYTRIGFFHYLQSLHGFEAAVRAIAENEPAQLGAPTWEAHARAWASYIEAACAPLFEQ